MGGESGRGSGRVGSGRVRLFLGNRESGWVNVSAGRVGSKKSDPLTTLVCCSMLHAGSNRIWYAVCRLYNIMLP